MASITNVLLAYFERLQRYADEGRDTSFADRIHDAAIIRLRHLLKEKLAAAQDVTALPALDAMEGLLLPGRMRKVFIHPDVINFKSTGIPGLEPVPGFKGDAVRELVHAEYELRLQASILGALRDGGHYGSGLLSQGAKQSLGNALSSIGGSTSKWGTDPSCQASAGGMVRLRAPAKGPRTWEAAQRGKRPSAPPGEDPPPEVAAADSQSHAQDARRRAYDQLVAALPGEWPEWLSQRWIIWFHRTLWAAAPDHIASAAADAQRRLEAWRQWGEDFKDLLSWDILSPFESVHLPRLVNPPSDNIAQIGKLADGRRTMLSIPSDATHHYLTAVETDKGSMRFTALYTRDGLPWAIPRTGFDHPIVRVGSDGRLYAALGKQLFRETAPRSHVMEPIEIKRPPFEEPGQSCWISDMRFTPDGRMTLTLDVGTVHPKGTSRTLEREFVIRRKARRFSFALQHKA